MANKNTNNVNLKVTKKELPNGKIQLSVTIPAGATRDIYTSGMFILAMQNGLDVKNIKIEDLESEVLKTVGEAQFYAFLNHYAPTALAPHAISKAGIEPIMEPDVNSSMEFAPDKEFAFTAVVTPKPHYELTSYDPVVVTIPKVTITDEEIDEQLLNLADRTSTSEVLEDGEVGLNCEVVFSLSTSLTDTGETIDYLTADRRVYELGRDFMPKEFDENLLGMKVNETRTFDYVLPGMIGLAGEPDEPHAATSTVTITQINQRVVPTIDDAWVTENFPEAKNVEGLRAMMREQGMEFKTKELDDMKFFLVASELAKRFQGKIADEIFEFTRNEMLANLDEQLKQNGMTMEEYTQNIGMDQQQFNMSFMVHIRETLRQGFSLDALARHLKLTASEADIQDALTRMAPGNEDRARSDIEGSGRSYILTEAALRTMANKWLADTASYVEEEMK